MLSPVLTSISRENITDSVDFKEMPPGKILLG